jgi:glutathione S-transferase
VLELYYYENSICAERALMTLAEKRIDDWVPRHIDLFKGEQFNPEYLKLNPRAQVPTLVHDGAVIRESSVICDYLDDLKAENPLKPGNRVAAAHMQEFVKDADEAGYQGVASLSFTAIFRHKLMAMSEAGRNAYWNGQTDIERTHRQQSCVFEGLDSPYALRAIASWERTFGNIEDALAHGRTWLMGDQFTLAEINLAPFVARLDGLRMLPVWLDDRPRTRTWWSALKARPSYVAARVGPSGGEAEVYAREGAKVVDDLRQRRIAYRERFTGGRPSTAPRS